MSEAIDVEEAYRRVPTLRLIDDVGLRLKTAQETMRAPPYFWEVPASTSGYHHPLCREERGLWIHTLMLSTVIDELADSRRELKELEDRHVDHAHAAAILHDQRKNGDPDDPSTSSVSDHDLRMGRVLREADADFPKPVVSAVESHMGPWYDGPEPSGPVERLVHTADMIASTASITPAVHGPLPEELEGRGLEVIDS